MKGSLSLQRRPQLLHGVALDCRRAFLAKGLALLTPHLPTGNAAIVERTNFNPTRISLRARLLPLAGSANGLPRSRQENRTSGVLHAVPPHSKRRSATVLLLVTCNPSVLRGSRLVQQRQLRNRRARPVLLESTLPRQSIDAAAMTIPLFRAHKARICRTRAV